MDLGDLQAEIDSLKQQIRAKQAAPSSAEQRLEKLQQENDELKLYLAAILRMMVAKKLATVDEIKALVAAVDREDGVEDRKYKGPVVPEA
jgi:hypothetical protein